MWLRWLIRGWIWQSFQQEVARQAELQSQDDSTDPPIAVLFALGIESGGFEDLLEDVKHIQGYQFSVLSGRLGERPILLCKTGVGLEAAQRAAKTLLSGHQPSWVISAGFAGGLQPELEKGHFLLATEVMRSQQERLDLDLHFGDGIHAGNTHFGSLLTVDRILETSDQKKACAAETGAMAADMETYGIATACAQRGAKFLSVRVISDDVEESLPRGLNRMMQKKSTAHQMGALFTSVSRRPSTVKDLWKLRERAIVASDRLAKFLKSVIDQLPNP